MRTLPNNTSHAALGDYPAKCDICNSVWLRSEMRVEEDGLLKCPQHTGADVAELARLNAEMSEPYSLALDRDQGRPPTIETDGSSFLQTLWAESRGGTASYDPLNANTYTLELSDPTPPALSVPASYWWKAASGVTSSSSELTVWTDTVSGTRLVPAEAGLGPQIPSAGVDELGGYIVPYFNEDNGDDELWAEGSPSDWSCLHDGSGVTFWMHWRPTLGGGQDALFRTLENEVSVTGKGGMVCSYSLDNGVFRAGFYDTNGKIGGFLGTVNPGGNYSLLLDESEAGTVKLAQFPSATPTLQGSSNYTLVYALKRNEKPYEYDRLIFIDGELVSRKRANMYYPPGVIAAAETTFRLSPEGRGTSITTPNPMRGYIAEFGLSRDFLPENERFELAKYLHEKYRKRWTPA